jgi:septum site-determining protein MinD
MEIIGIISGRGGVGKTTTTINLGIALTQLGNSVVVMDDGLPNANLDLLLNQEHLSRKMSEGNSLLPKNLLTHYSGIKIVPHYISSKLVNLKPTALKKKLEKNLNENFLLIDFSSAINEVSDKLLSVCDSTIIVTTPNLASVYETVRVKRYIENLEKSIRGIILNRKGFSKFDLTPREIEIGFNLPLFDIIPEDREVEKSWFKRQPLLCYNPYAKASIAFKRIAAKLVGKDYKPERFLFLKRLKHWLVSR